MKRVPNQAVTYDIGCSQPKSARGGYLVKDGSHFVIEQMNRYVLRGSGHRVPQARVCAGSDEYAGTQGLALERSDVQRRTTYTDASGCHTYCHLN